MKVAVLSDIHGNLEAFERVLEDLRQTGADAVISLGDNVGYGPDPDSVIALLCEMDIPSVMGNHELAIGTPAYLRWFNPVARESLEKTLGMLSRSSLEFISRLKYSRVDWNCRFVHGYPPRSAKTYLFQVSRDRLCRTFERMRERICFVGHTHDLELIVYDGGEVTRQPLTKGFTRLNPDQAYIINVGSVGQPRDGNNNAKYVIWDTAEHLLELKFIPYDIAAVAGKIIAAGLPRAHARRLG